MSTSSMHKGLTLVEVIISLIVLAFIVVSIYRSYMFFLNNIAFYLKRADTHMEIDYALENIRTHTISAISISPESMFTAGVTSNRQEFDFTGESNVSNITPDDESDNAQYRYYMDQGNFVLQTGDTTKETLISSYLKPAVTFTYTADTEPNFMTVTIAAGPSEDRINKTEGMRLWFVDVVE